MQGFAGARVSRPPPDLEDLDFSAIKGEDVPAVSLDADSLEVEGEGLAALRREAMVIEDDPDMGRLLRFILEREGFDVTLVTDGRVASSLLGSGAPPAIVTLDLLLPYVNGYELLAMIRKTPGWAEVPVLMLSAKSRESDIVRALDGGANDYLTKPFKPAELKARIRRLLAKQ